MLSDFEAGQLETIKQQLVSYEKTDNDAHRAFFMANASSLCNAMRLYHLARTGLLDMNGKETPLG